MAKAKPLTDDERQRIAALHAEGQSRAAIARELGRSADAVGTAAKAMGLTWDRSKTAAATEAKQLDNRAKRQALIARMYDRAGKVMDRLDAPTFKHVAESFGRAEVTHLAADAIPPAAEKQLGGMAVNYLLGAAKLEAIDTDDGSARAKGMLDRLWTGLESLSGQLGDAAGSDGGE